MRNPLSTNLLIIRRNFFTSYSNQKTVIWGELLRSSPPPMKPQNPLANKERIKDI